MTDEGGGKSPNPSGNDGLQPCTMLVSVWAVSVLVWSIFAQPDKTVAARALLLQPLWLFRLTASDPTWVQDLALTLILHDLYTLLWSRSWSLLSIRQFDFTNDVFLIYLEVFALLTICAFFAAALALRGKQLEAEHAAELSKGPIREQRVDEFLLPPLLIKSRTTHSRFFPRKHAFSYSYLFVGIPVGMQGRVGNVISLDTPRPAWFHVRSSDFLTRGDPSNSPVLAEKLTRYLHTQGVREKDYDFAYLVTAPRFLGYSFNPVSFWYIYDEDARLKYMVLEVNNTFDERRMYLLKADQNVAEDEAEGDGFVKTIFTDTWEKDFHVSPFNSRKGSYSLKAVDPLAALQETGSLRIDNTIVLRSSKDQTKLVARVCSEGSPIEPDQISIFHLARFIASWWWVGLATFPRIVWEAQKLFFRKKLHVWYRPEVVQTSIGRAYTADEKALEDIFCSFLTHSVESFDKALRVIYEPAHYDGNEIVLYSPGFTHKEAQSTTLSIKILSPAFYSRFVHYAHAKEAFDRECLATDDKNRTLTIEGLEALPLLLRAMNTAHERSETNASKPGFLDGFKWRLLRRLRCPPPKPSYISDENVSEDDRTVHDIRAFHFSELDRFMQHPDPDGAAAYIRIAVKLFLAERVGFGLPVLVTVFDWLLRAVLTLAAIRVCETSFSWDLLWETPVFKPDIVRSGLGLLLANSIHLWSLVKG